MLNRLTKKQIKEDYTSGPWSPPNDTTYPGFFFEKDVHLFPKDVRLKYEQMKKEILKKEQELKEKFGDDWKNVAVFQAYRLAKKEANLE